MTQLSNLSIVEARRTAIDAPEGINAMREHAAEELSTLALPTRKTEAWKYTARRLGELNQLSSAAKQSDVNSGTSHQSDQAPNIEHGVKIVIQNGVVHLEQGEMQQEGPVSVKRFTELDEAETALVREYSERESGEFERINTAVFEDGLFIRLAKNQELEAPLLIDYVLSDDGFATPRVFVVAEQSSDATVIENYVSSDSAEQFCANQTTFLVEGNAKLTYVRMNNLGHNYRLATTTRAALKRDAQFESHSLCLGAGMVRHDLHVLMLEKGAHCSLNGVVVTKDKQHFDNHTNIEHIASNCTSDENYRCIADNSSHIVFNGRIHIHKDAQKTLGEMNNRNLLLSSSAEIDTKPELEIYADDVKCAHGATIGQLDEKEVYYLKTRGLSDDQARQMLTLGFVLELVRSLPIEGLAEQWEQTVAQLLSFKEQE